MKLTVMLGLLFFISTVFAVHNPTQAGTPVVTTCFSFQTQGCFFNIASGIYRGTGSVVFPCAGIPALRHYTGQPFGTCSEVPPGDQAAGGIFNSVPCIAGQYSLFGYLVCHPCPVGTFGTGVSVLDRDSPTCSGLCPLGFYGDSTGLTTSSCTGQCDAGFYGDSLGQTAPDCTGPCSGGFFCNAGSTSATQNPCETGNFCPIGSSGPTICPAGSYCPGQETELPIPCPEGTFGNETGLEDATCSGNCSLGALCPEGSTTNETLCPIGFYCPIGSAIFCPGGTFGNETGLSDPTCSGNCTAGFFCLGGSTATDSILCPAGTFCPPASSNPTPCEFGTFNVNEGETNSSACITCPAGFFCPFTSLPPVICPAGSFCEEGSSSALFCLSSGSFCPEGSSAETPCPAGAFCENAFTIELCPVATYNALTGQTSISSCLVCPVGVYGNGTGLNTSTCTAICPAGAFCPAGSVDPTLCLAGRYRTSPGGIDLLSCTSCPSGTYGANPGETSSNCSGPCDDGFWCTAANTDPMQFLCDPGRFGVGANMEPLCSGPCVAGFFCPENSTAANQTICLIGFYCPGQTGEPIPCPAGAFGSEEGLTDALCSGLCE